MTWHPAKVVTPEQRDRAVQLLNTEWAEGKVWEENGVQYRAAWHPSHTPGGPLHHGVEVWVNEDIVPSPAPTAMTTTQSLKATEGERETVLQEGEKRGWPRDELSAAINIESGWNPHAVNPSTNAGGLIGFMPFVLRALGWTRTPREFYAQTAAEQAPWVGKFFDYIGKKWRLPGDTYVALAASGHVGEADSVVVYPQGSKAWQLNPGWRPAGGGDITVGSIRAVLLRHMGGTVSHPAAPKAPVPPDGSLPGVSYWLLLLQQAMVRDGRESFFRPPEGSGAQNVVVALQQSLNATGADIGVDGVIGDETLGELVKRASEKLT